MKFESWKLLSWFLAGLQLLCLFLLMVTGSLLPMGWGFRGVALLSALLAVWALVSMNRRTFSVLPDPRPTSTLVVHGPYQYIRHPMYTALLLFTLVLVIEHFTILRFAVWVILLFDLLTKLLYEEELLAKQFQEYSEYMRRTFRLIPFVF